MADTIYNELDPVFETMGLLFVSCHFDKVKQETKNGIAEFGFDGEQFYSKQLKTYDKYVQIFQKNKVTSEEDNLFLGEESFHYFVIFLSLMMRNRNWLISTEDITDDMFKEKILQSCMDVFEEDASARPETMEEMIGFLEKSGLEDRAKWKLLNILRQPKKYMNQLVNLVNENIKYFHKAMNEIEKPLAKLIEQYLVTAGQNGKQVFYELKTNLLQGTFIYPTLVFPVSQMIFEDGCYCGLVCDKVIRNGKSRPAIREGLLYKLKALSDGSKLEIINSLKISPKYNLEIAQQLGLTAATMSYHMNVLLNCGFVGIEKREGKVYYHLERENIQSMIRDLEQTLL